MRCNIFTCFFLFFMLTACQEEGVFFNQQVAIKDHVWTSSEPISFDFNIQDTIRLLNAGTGYAEGTTNLLTKGGNGTSLTFDIVVGIKF